MKFKQSPAGFVCRVALMAILPLVPFILLYVALDPYKVLRSHDDYFSEGLGVNKGVVSYNLFNRQNPAANYDSFIIGASISCYYPVEHWRRHLPPRAVPFHFDSSGQTVHSTRLFLEYLDSHADSINNLLIVLSPHVLGLEYNHNALPSLLPPGIDESGWLYPVSFHYKYFRRLSTYGYYGSLLPWLVRGVKEDLLHQNIFEQQPIRHDRAINEESIPSWDEWIMTDSAAFYARYQFDIPADTATYKVLESRITPAMKADFKAMASIIHRRGTGACVLFSPTLSLELLSADDDAFLRDTFGDSYVNLCGEFRQELGDRKNFYDGIHYRPPLAVKFMDRAYETIDSRRTCGESF